MNWICKSFNWNVPSPSFFHKSVIIVFYSRTCQGTTHLKKIDQCSRHEGSKLCWRLIKEVIEHEVTFHLHFIGPRFKSLQALNLSMRQRSSTNLTVASLKCSSSKISFLGRTGFDRLILFFYANLDNNKPLSQNYVAIKLHNRVNFNYYRRPRLCFFFFFFLSVLVPFGHFLLRWL